MKTKLDEIIDTVDGLENDHSNVEFDRDDRDKKIKELTETVNEMDMKIEIIMKHFEIEARTIVYVTAKKGINRELLKRLLASKRYDYERIAEIVGCSELELMEIIDEMSDAGAHKG